MMTILRQANLDNHVYEEQYVKIRREGSKIVFDGGIDNEGVGLNFEELKKVVAMLDEGDDE